MRNKKNGVHQIKNQEIMSQLNILKGIILPRFHTLVMFDFIFNIQQIKVIKYIFLRSR